MTEDITGAGDGELRETPEAILAELDQQVGQPKLKKQVQSLFTEVRAAQARKAQGIDSEPLLVSHLLFIGPPGEEEITVAQLVARLYKALGILPTGQVVEVNSADLVGQYIGETTSKTTEKINEAMGGVLFIDEAYTLSDEAICTLLPRMLKDQGKFLVIAAGRPDQMDLFLTANPGLARWFWTRIKFPPSSIKTQPSSADNMNQPLSQLPMLGMPKTLSKPVPPTVPKSTKKYFYSSWDEDKLRKITRLVLIVLTLLNTAFWVRIKFPYWFYNVPGIILAFAIIAFFTAYDFIVFSSIVFPLLALAGWALAAVLVQPPAGLVIVHTIWVFGFAAVLIANKVLSILIDRRDYPARTPQ